MFWQQQHESPFSVTLKGVAAGRKTKVPFGPFMLVGALIGIMAGGPIASAYTSFTLG